MTHTKDKEDGLWCAPEESKEMTGHRCITKDPSDGQLLVYWGAQTGYLDESVYSSYPKFASEFFNIDRWEVVAIPGEFL